jgi:hypothetical protein
MDSTIQNSTGLRVEIDQSRARQTPKTDFGSVLSTGLSRTGNAIAQSAQIAAPFVPGGAVLSAAVTGVGSIRASAAGDTASLTSYGAPNSSMLVAGNSLSTGALGATGSVSSGGSVTGGGTTVAGLAASGNADAVLQQNAAQMQEMNQSFNLQYLMLQENMQQEQRQFSLLSNIMKTRHDGAKNAINNVR